MNLHLLPLFISYRSSGEKLIKYQANSSCVIMSVILMTTLFYKALILQGEIWCWSLLGLKGLISAKAVEFSRVVLDSQAGKSSRVSWNITRTKTFGTRGGSRIFFRRGCTRLFNTNKPHSFVFCRIQVVLENRKSSRGGGGGAPLHPPPRSAPVYLCSNVE